VKVFFDVFELTPCGGKSMGIFNYAVNLTRNLIAALPDDVELVLPCHGDNIAHFTPAAAHGRVHVLKLAQATPNKWRRQAWTRWGALKAMKAHGCDLYFSPKGFMPGWRGAVQGVKTCVVVHDLIPFWYREHFPAQFSRLEQWLVTHELARSCQHAGSLVTISHTAAHDIARRLPGARTPRVVYNGLPPSPAKLVPPNVQRPYLLAMSSSLPHKNARGLLEGYAHYRRLTETPLDLVVCGIDDPRMPGVRAVKGVNDAELHGLYQGATWFIFLSLTEGFGFPPLEAMQYGTPVLCSDIEVLRETTRGHAVFVDPHSPQAIGQAIQHGLSPEGMATAERLRSGSLEVVNHYSWAHCVDGVLQAMRCAWA
jgi:glycosyltransferase involved in cell wall biosynthesis